MDKFSRSILIFCLAIVTVLASGCGTVTAVPSPTGMPNPSFTPSIETFPIDATSQAFWANVKATLNARNAVCKDGYDLVWPELVLKDLHEQWTVITCSPATLDSKTKYTQVVSSDGTRSWIISHQDFEWSTGSDKAKLKPYRWTLDGNYVYLVAERPGGSGFDTERQFMNGIVLYRLDLNTGEFITVLLAKGWQGMAYSLSPDNYYLAYAFPEEKNIVYIRDMESGETKEIQIGNNYILTGALVWEPNSAKLVFASALDGWKDDTAGISIFVLTIRNMYAQTLLENDMRLLIPYPHYENGEFFYWYNEDNFYVRSLRLDSDLFYSTIAIDIGNGKVNVVETPKPGLGYTPTPQP